MKYQPFEGIFLLFIAEAGNGAQGAAIARGRETGPVYDGLVRHCGYIRNTTLDRLSNAPSSRIAERGGFPSEQILVPVSGENLSGLGLIAV